jgi:hypothetical protein
MAIIRNMTGAVARFVNAEGEIAVTLQPDATTVLLRDADTVAQFQGVALHTERPAAFVDLPNQVAGTEILVTKGIAWEAWSRGKNRPDLYEPFGRVFVDGQLCFKGARRYID